MYKLNFLNPGEIRMGSPYNIADVDLSGGFVPNLDGHEFQDKGRVSASGDTVLLVEWALLNNEPGFIVWLVSHQDGTVKKSPRQEGLCDGVEFLSTTSVKVRVSSSGGGIEEVTMEFS